MSSRYHVLPAAIVGFTDEVAAYGLNRAVWMWGTALENTVREVTESAKNKHQAQFKARTVYAKWLSKPGETPRGVYRDPVAS